MDKKILKNYLYRDAEPDIVETAKNDEPRREKNCLGAWVTRCRYMSYLDAEISQGNLIIYIYFRDDLICGERRPVSTVFISKNEMEHVSFNRQTGTWRNGKIDSQYSPQAGRYYHYELFMTKQCKNAICKYLAEYEGSEISRVLEFQKEVAKQRLFRKDKKKLDYIDSVMEKVKPVPKDLEKWGKRNALKHYLIYQGLRSQKSNEALCTACEKMVTVIKPRHNEEAYCPRCKAKATYKSWNKQNELIDGNRITLIQPYEIGKYIFRDFAIVRRLYRDDAYEIKVRITEDTRAIMNERFVQKEYFDHALYRNTGVLRWVYSEMYTKGGYYYSSYYNQFPDGVLYPRNLKKVFEDTGINHKTVINLATDGIKRVAVQFYLQRIYRYPYIEYVKAAGLNALAEEMLKNREQPNLFNHYASKLTAALKINGQQLRKLKAIDGDCRMLEILQAENGEYIHEDLLREIQENRLNIDLLSIKNTGLSVLKTMNYFKRQLGKSKNYTCIYQVATTYRDYIDMAIKLDIDPHDDIVRLQPNLEKWHAKYTLEVAKIENKKAIEEANLKYSDIKNNFERNRKHFEMKYKELQIIPAKSAGEIKIEGRVQHHCVGGDGYLKKMNTNKTFILLLRKKSNPKKAYYTVEADWEGNIKQFYAAFDRQPNKDEIQKWLEHWSKIIKKRVKEA